MYDNPIERLLTFQMRAAKKHKSGVIEVHTYTFFGIRYSIIYASCGDITEDENAGLIQRRWEHK